MLQEEHELLKKPSGSKTTAVSAGTRFYDLAFKKPLDQLDVTESTRENIRRLATVEPQPFVTRVVFIATAQFQPTARARRFFCFFLRAARLRAVFLRFFTRMAVSYRLGELGAVLGDVRRS